MSEGFSYTNIAEFDVINTFSTVQLAVQASMTSDNWVAGSFKATSSFKTKFSVTGAVSKVGITATVQIYEVDDTASPKTGRWLSEAASLDTVEQQRVVAARPVEFVSGRIYQVRVRVAGGDTDSDFAVINSILLEVA